MYSFKSEIKYQQVLHPQPCIAEWFGYVLPLHCSCPHSLRPELLLQSASPNLEISVWNGQAYADLTLFIQCERLNTHCTWIWLFFSFSVT